MPMSDQDKDTTTLLSELHSGIPGNFTALIAKVTELQARQINSGDADDYISAEHSTAMTRGGIRPKHAPLVP